MTFDPDATVVRPRAPRARDPDATVIRHLEPAAPAVRAAPVTAAPLAAGARLHEYRIDGVLGRGGFGITYLATDVHLNARVAIKEYLPQEIAFRSADGSVGPSASRHRERYRQGLESFLVEARTLAGFRHPAIVRVARFFEAHRTAYMVLEYERGTSFKAWWTEHRQGGEAALVDKLQPLLDGLAVLHASRVLHRDIKPDNIQVRADDGQLVLLDFGSAGQAVAVADGAAVVVTPGYAAPEQYGAGHQGPWTDLYALGATLYWAVAGRKPPDAETRVADPRAYKRAVEAGRGRFGEAFLRAIDWALALQPAERPHDVLAFRHALFADHRGSLPLHAALKSGDTVIEGDHPEPRRSRWRAALRTLATPTAWPLALKTTLAMLAVALVPMVLAAVYNERTGGDALADSELRYVRQLAHSTAGRLAQFAEDSRRYTRVLASDLDLVVYLAAPDDAGAALVRERLARHLRGHADARQATLLDGEGRALVTAASAATPDNVPGVEFAEAVTGDDGRRMGTLVVRLAAAPVVRILDEVRHDSALTPLLVDRRGRHVPAGQPLEEPKLAQAMTQAGQPGHIDYVAARDGEPQIAGYAPVPGLDWVVGVAESRERFEAPLEVLQTRLRWSIGLVGLIAGAFALRFALGIVRPVRDLTRAANALKAGDFHDATVPVRRKDEIGQLVRTFNVMIDVLRQRERERR
jgi:serine/threonine protein kinase/HAMP domain-containing protein